MGHSGEMLRGVEVGFYAEVPLERISGDGSGVSFRTPILSLSWGGFVVGSKEALTPKCPLGWVSGGGPGYLSLTHPDTSQGWLARVGLSRPEVGQAHWEPLEVVRLRVGFPASFPLG